MVDLLEAVFNQGRRNYCFVTSPLATGLQALDERLGPSFEENADELVDGAVGLFRNAQQLVCNRFPNTRDEILAATPPPFTGGQCAELYSIVVEVIDNGVVNPNTITYNNFGPISGIGTRPGSSSGTFWFINVSSQFGDPVEQGIQDNTPDSREFKIREVFLFDGSPDTCGDPPGQLPTFNPGDNRVTDVPVDYEDDDGNPQTTDVDFDFGPVEIGPDGDFSIPVCITFDNGAEVCVDFNLTDDEFTGPSSPPDEENQPLSPGDNPEEDGVLIKGVVVTATYDPNVSAATEIFQEGAAPSIYAPRLGYVTFLYQLADGSKVVGADIPVKRLNQVIWTPESAINAYGNPNPGSQFTLTFIREDEPKCC